MTLKKLNTLGDKHQIWQIGTLVPFIVFWALAHLLMERYQDFILIGGFVVLAAFSIKNIFDQKKYAQRSYLINTISNKWKWNPGLMVLYLFQIYIYQEDFSMVLAFTMLIIMAVLQIFPDLRQLQYLTRFGLFEVPSFRKLLDPAKIIAIRIKDDRIEIDTTKYRNDLVYTRKIVRQPAWEELQRRYAEMRSVWLPESEVVTAD